jgi:hypothetical protein
MDQLRGSFLGSFWKPLVSRSSNGAQRASKRPAATKRQSSRAPAPSGACHTHLVLGDLKALGPWCEGWTG